MAKSGGLLTGLDLTKAEQGLDLAQVWAEEPSCVGPPLPQHISCGGRSLPGATDGKPEHPVR